MPDTRRAEGTGPVKLICPVISALTIALLSTMDARGATTSLTSDADADGVPDYIEEKLCTPVDIPQRFVQVAVSPDREDSAEDAERSAPDILQFDACHVGAERLLFRIAFARKPTFADAVFIVYADVDNDKNTGRVDPHHGGVDVMLSVQRDNLSVSCHNPVYSPENTRPAGAVHDRTLYVSVDLPLGSPQSELALGLHLLTQRQGGRSDSTPHSVVQLPRQTDVNVPKLPPKRSASLRSLADYRYVDDAVKLEKLDDKGLTRRHVESSTPITFGRPRPRPQFAAARTPGKRGSVDNRRIAIHLLEEADTDRRQTPVSFGLPLPPGALYDLDRIAVLAPSGGHVSAQFAATSFWPDDSLKWVLVDFSADLRAGTEASYALEFGNDVRAQPADSALEVDENGTTITVTTGPVQVRIDRQRFDLFHDVCLDRNLDGRFAADERIAGGVGQGVRLVDEHGKVFTTAAAAPTAIAVEQSGPEKVVLRVEGAYTSAAGETYMSYVTRLTFRNGSSRVTIAHTHVNTYLETEFTDIESLSIPVQLAGSAMTATAFVRTGDGALSPLPCEIRNDTPLSVLQLDESTSQLSHASAARDVGKYSGLLRYEGNAGALGMAVHEFWQRWPKGFAADSGECSIDLLPKQPGTDYGSGLPHWLIYPFVSGKYRFKWGMSFTQRVTFDFGCSVTAEQLHADANLPVVAVLPAEWYASTGALGPMAAPYGEQFTEWDNYARDCHKAFSATRDRERCYGYLNYGDWYGERGRNWGNNEYDLAHGFLLQFARTGEREHFRLALAAARHQADVDCVHAYPDPAYVGANHLHSIGHTGAWSQHLVRATWTWAYDYHTAAANGHTWASGMMDAWHLTGEARIMDACIGLGEHIAWSMSRTFTHLGTHERSAGWSLHATMAIYRGTYDPVYLDAAKRIAAVALKEQKMDEGGSWPHILPRDHAGGHRGARGNNLFLIGVLLAGLQDVHEQTGDPTVLKSLIAGTDWVMRSWDEDNEGWPYSADTDGKPLYARVTPSLNNLIIGPLAYVGTVTGNDRLLATTDTAFTAIVQSGAPAFGKSIAQKMHFVPAVIHHLQSWYARTRPDKGAHVLDGRDDSVARRLARTRDAVSHKVRAPDTKRFYVKATAPNAELLLLRQPHGAMTKRSDECGIRITDSKGDAIAQAQFSTDAPCEFRTNLAADGGEYRVVIDDDQRGVWSLQGDKLQVVMETVAGFRIGGVGRARYHFHVPEGSKRFTVDLLGVHRGAYGAVVFSPDGKVAATHRGQNLGLTHIKGAPQGPGAESAKQSAYAQLELEPDPADTGQLWSLVLWAHMDIGCELRGIPPFLALSAEDWFPPSQSVREATE